MCSPFDSDALYLKKTRTWRIPGACENAHENRSQEINWRSEQSKTKIIRFKLIESVLFESCSGC